MKKIFLLLFTTMVSVFVFTQNAVGQYSDYVITINGDLIPCNITTPLFGTVRYQGASMAKAEKIKPDVIKEYYISWKEERLRAVFKDSSSKPMFMTVIEKGKIGLYEMIYTYNNGFGGSGSTTTWYIGKGSDYVKDFKSSGIFLGKSRKERKDYLGDLLKDNQAVYDKYMAEDKFSFKQIQNLVHLYNTGQPLNE